MPAVQADGRAGHADRRRPVQVRLRHRHRDEKAPKGLNEDTVRFISAKKGEPEWMLEWRLDAYRALAGHDRADLGQGPLSEDRLPGHLLLLGAQEHGRARRASTRSIRSCSRPTRSSAFRSRSARCWPASRARRVAVDAVFDSRLGGHDLQGGAGARPASSSARSRRRSASTPSSCRSISARSCRSPTISTRR